jgi:hypothetical protein
MHFEAVLQEEEDLLALVLDHNAGACHTRVLRFLGPDRMGNHPPRTT